MQIDIQKIAEQLVQELQLLSDVSKVRAEGVIMLYQKIVAAAAEANKSEQKSEPAKLDEVIPSNKSSSNNKKKQGK
jgi:hypothetical protein